MVFQVVFAAVGGLVGFWVRSFLAYTPFVNDCAVPFFTYLGGVAVGYIYVWCLWPGWKQVSIFANQSTKGESNEVQESKERMKAVETSVKPDTAKIVPKLQMVNRIDAYFWKYEVIAVFNRSRRSSVN